MRVDALIPGRKLPRSRRLTILATDAAGNRQFVRIHVAHGVLRPAR